MTKYATTRAATRVRVIVEVSGGPWDTRAMTLEAVEAQAAREALDAVQSAVALVRTHALRVVDAEAVTTTITREPPR